MSATCRWCGRPMRWLKSTRDRNLCVDPDPDPAGNVAVIDGRARVLKGDALAEWKGQRWMPHAATCTHMTSRTGTKRTT